ncbi:leucine-rich repeat domain-containing protein [Roseibacillus ishigakijimensis]|uniref:leucine-rich repeat domain-containing protein n=1 Tax=Roseibacillus ishigakijimensis TaxID=454146 RepID=UPI0027DE0429|nr:leucine-rich repeat domain-containing protein [Roseibacillus ishigakijimensis]
MPESTTRIFPCAFWGCSSLKEAVLPNSVRWLGDCVFMDCVGLERVKLPDSINIIQSQFFNGCSSLKTIEIPKSVTKVESAAFFGCSELQRINLPPHLELIEVSAFSWCSALSRIIFTGPPPIIEGSVFRGAPENIKALVPFAQMESYLHEESFEDRFNFEGYDPPKILNFGFVNDAAFFIEHSPGETNYQVVASDDMVFGNWITVEEYSVSKIGSIERIEFPFSASRKFFRIEVK